MFHDNVTANVLIVGGGSGARYDNLEGSEGGGGGAVAVGTLMFNANTLYTITVGSGGTYANTGNTRGTMIRFNSSPVSGTSSSINNVCIAYGGGYGNDGSTGGNDGSTGGNDGSTGGNGGSDGGGTINTINMPGGSSTKGTYNGSNVTSNGSNIGTLSYFGNNGATCRSAFGGGGGGGAMYSGGSSTQTVTGTGGAGFKWSVNDTYYGGGGGGGSGGVSSGNNIPVRTGGLGGTESGGNGGSYYNFVLPTNGVAQTGGGGGGGHAGNNNVKNGGCNGGNGGSGIVIIAIQQYASQQYSPLDYFKILPLPNIFTSNTLTITDQTGPNIFKNGNYVTSESSGATSDNKSWAAFNGSTTSFCHSSYNTIDGYTQGPYLYSHINGEATYQGGGSNYHTTMVGNTSYEGEWIQIKFPFKFVLTYYSIYPRESIPWNNGGLKTFYVVGSNNGSTWNLLDSQTLIELPTTLLTTFEVTPTNSYSYYRLIINKIFAQVGYRNSAYISQWNLYSSHILSVIASQQQASQQYVSQQYASTITGSKLAASNLTKSQQMASTITGSNLAASTITASDLAASNLAKYYLTRSQQQESQQYASTITGSDLAASNLAEYYLTGSQQQASQQYASTITGSNLAASNLAEYYLTRSQQYASQQARNLLVSPNNASVKTSQNKKYIIIIIIFIGILTIAGFMFLKKNLNSYN